MGRSLKCMAPGPLQKQRKLYLSQTLFNRVSYVHVNTNLIQDTRAEKAKTLQVATIKDVDLWWL